MREASLNVFHCRLGSRPIMVVRLSHPGREMNDLVVCQPEFGTGDFELDQARKRYCDPGIARYGAEIWSCAHVLTGKRPTVRSTSGIRDIIIISRVDRGEPPSTARRGSEGGPLATPRDPTDDADRTTKTDLLPCHCQSRPVLVLK